MGFDSNHTVHEKGEPPAARQFVKNLQLETIYFLPILYIPVPQVGQVPFIAGLPFFIVTGVGFFISFFALHLTQYASTTYLHLPSLAF